MNIEEIRKKYQCDEGRTFAQWKEWVRKTKPSQAQAHIVKAVAPNGSKYERLIGGYTDAQNTAFDLVSHGYKDVKLYHSVNAGPLKLLRNFSAPLHGAKFKDSCDAVDGIRQKYENDASLSQKKDQPVKVTNISIKPSPVGGFEGNVYYSKNGETDLYSPWHIMANGKWGFPFGRSSTRLTQSDKKLIEQKIKKLVSQKGVKVKDSVDYVDSIREKYQSDAVGAGVVVPSFKAKTDVFKRLASGNEPNAFNKAKNGLLDLVKTIESEIKRQKSRNIPDEQKAKIVKRLEGELEDAKKSIELYKKGRQTGPMTTKAWNRAMLGRGVNWKAKDSADAVDSIREKYCIDFVMKNDIVHLPRAATYRVEIKINGQPFIPMIALRDAEGTKKDKIAKQAMEYFKKTYWSDPRPFNKSLDKSKAKLTVGKIQYKTDGRSNWEDMR